ncbi:MAG: hypothetical protein ACI9CE_003900 [Flavobacterium sp.]|jgi:hypothetical protein
MSIYSEKHRELQASFDSQALAERLESIIVKTEIGAVEQAFIESREFLFLSTITPDGGPTVSFKGGAPGFVQVLNEKQIAFPNYNGNGMFFSTGNLSMNPSIGILFMDFEHPHRIRFHGNAQLSSDKEILARFPEAELVVIVALDKLWVNCPRYIPKMQKVKSSVNVPKEGEQTPLAEWKRLEAFHDVLPDKDRQRIKDEGGPIDMTNFPKNIIENT